MCNLTVQFNGAIYVFEQSEDKKGKPTKKKNIEEVSRVLSGADLKDKFPQKSTTFLKTEKMNKYWNFLNDEGTSLKKEPFKKDNWHMFVRPENGGIEEITSGSSNLEVWGKHFFGDQLGKIADAIGHDKGKWV